MNTITYIKTALITLLILCSSNFIAQEQQIVIPLSNPNKVGTLKVFLINGSITVSGYTGKDVVINTKVRANTYKKKKINKYGLKKIESTSNEFTVEEVDNVIRVKPAHNHPFIDFEIKVPKKFNLKLKTINRSNIYVEHVNGEIEVSNINGKVDMKDISGSVIADALNKNITISFKKVFDNIPMAFTSLNGNIDITFPKSLKADIKAKSDNGDVYTDFEIKMDSKPVVKRSNSSGVYKVKVEKWAFGSINGGGTKVTFKTLNGDIIIRKREN